MPDIVSQDPKSWDPHRIRLVTFRAHSVIFGEYGSYYMTLKNWGIKTQGGHCVQGPIDVGDENFGDNYKKRVAESSGIFNFGHLKRSLTVSSLFFVTNIVKKLIYARRL